MITPAWKESGESTETRAPAAVKLTIRLITLPSTLESARISWLELPWRAWISSPRVWALGASLRKRRPNG